MTNSNLLYRLFTILPLLAFPLLIHAQGIRNRVQYIGAMKNVMWKGELRGTISLDTLDKTGLYGVGPVEFLNGEVMIIDGKIFTSYAFNKDSIKVSLNEKVKAPFLVYSNIQEWTELDLPDNVSSIETIQAFLDSVLREMKVPAAFTIKGKADEATIHIMDVPAGTKITSPEDAHQFRKYYQVKNEEVEIVGFFSREHQGIFTHHDCFVHMHLVNESRSAMGHLDSINFIRGSVKLFIAKN